MPASVETEVGSDQQSHHHTLVCLFVPHVYVAAQPSPFNRFNKT